ncbi:MAG: trypsin-like peptidase domain-containing protein [Magnetococcales bacterium]|nr:trypsin-like peptidase domain-containing protein [Magnetococcales bacterium]
MSSAPEKAQPHDYYKYLFIVGIAAVFVMLGSYWYSEYITKGNLGENATVRNTGVSTHQVPNPTSNTPGLAPFGENMGQQIAVRQPAQPVNTFAPVVKSIMPSVVNVSATNAQNPATANVKNNNQQGGLDFAQPFSGVSQESIGSGIVVTKDGYILTNFHVIENSRHVNVTVFNALGTKHYHAEVVARDHMRDLALLKITPKSTLFPAALGNSERSQPGDSVIAIGSPFGLDQTVSKGIISGKNKIVNIGGTIHKGLLQTDAAINRGNSGGPLVDEEGYVIGVNTAIYTTTSAFSGVGFAVPMKTAIDFMEDLITLPGVKPNLIGQPAGIAVVAKGGGAPPIAADAVIAHEDRGPCETCHQILPATKVAAFAQGPNGMYSPNTSPYLQNNPDPANQFSYQPGGAIGMPVAAPQDQMTALGVALTPLDEAIGQRLRSPVESGAVVMTVQPGGAFAQSGLQADDIIFKLDGRRVKSPAALDKLLQNINSGETVRLSIVRNGDRLDKNLKVDRAGAQTVALQQPVQQPNQMIFARPQPSQTGNTWAQGRVDGNNRLVMQQGNTQAQPKKPAVVGAAKTEFDWMGLEMTPINKNLIAKKKSLKNKSGGLITDVDAGSSADRAGLRRGDIVVAINGKGVGSAQVLDLAIKKATGKAGVLLEVERKGQRMFTVLQ